MHAPTPLDLLESLGPNTPGIAWFSQGNATVNQGCNQIRHLCRHQPGTCCLSSFPASESTITKSSNPDTVTPQVFHITPLSYALVNLKPLLPGHVLVSPRRIVPRFNDLSPAEVSDLFLTVQRVSRMVERVFVASSLNIAIQDGIDAGQSVPHVHAHIIPRKSEDLKERGGTDAIYELMQSDEGDLGKQFAEKEKARSEASSKEADLSGAEKRNKFPAVDNDSRKPRSEEEMQQEAEWLAVEMSKDQKDGIGG